MAGSSLLAIMDDYAFNFEEEDSFVSENIGMYVLSTATFTDLSVLH